MEKIVVCPPGYVALDIVKSVAPKGFNMVYTSLRDPNFAHEMQDADYLVAIGDVRNSDDFYKNSPKLKLLQLLSAGYEQCDLGAAARAGVPICNNGGANAVGVSEHAIMLMLALSRRLPWVHNSMVSGGWRGNSAPAESLHEINSKTLGVIGLGTIGKKTARLAKAFGMHVFYYDIARLTEDQEDAMGVKFRALPEILRQSDIITMHVPLTPGTERMIGRDELAMMKPSAYFINTARGQVVDEQALADALNNHKLAGAGLDVFDNEPTLPSDAILKAENVILTPHIAGPVWDNWIARFRNCFDNCQRVSRGDTAFWIVPELRDGGRKEFAGPYKSVTPSS